MGRPLSKKKEQEFVLRFIDSLQKDIESSKHGSQTNWQVLKPAINLLKNPKLCPGLTVEQIVRGAMNMALALENEKYHILNAELIGEEGLRFFNKHSTRWFGDYSEGTVEAAIPVITRASMGPLFMMTSCVPNTLNLYFEYAKLSDETFITPQLPDVDAKYRGKGLETKQSFTFEWNIQCVKDSHSYQNEGQFLNNLIKDLASKTQDLKNSKTYNAYTTAAAENLLASLSITVHAYLDNELYRSLPRHEARSKFVKEATLAINNAKPILEKELGWGEYLVNLLKEIGNGFITATNFVTRTQFTLFPYAKAPLISEVEELVCEINNSMDWS